MKDTLKPILTILALVGLAALVYFYFIKQPESAPLTRTSSSGVTTSATEQRVPVSTAVNVDEFQRLLVELDSIDLQSELFSKQQYRELVDHTQTALIKLDETKAIAPISKQNPFGSLESNTTPVIILQGAPSGQVIPQRR